MRLPIAFAACMLTAACTAPSGGPAGTPGDSPLLRGTLHDGSGAERGTVEMRPHGAMLHVRVTANGLAPGMHGMHVHAVGSCVAPAFTSAGPHWNPDMKQHGHANPMGPHRGDLPQLNVSAKGRGTAEFDLPASAADIADADGSALVIHAAADDERTDPAGNSGARLLCAEIIR